MTRELLSKERQSVLGAFLYKFDIGQAYHHIDIDENHQKYLDFAWEIDGKNRYFMFAVLPFGLCSRQFIFSKVR